MHLVYRPISFQISICAFITGLVSLRSSTYKNTLTGSVAFKKLKSHSQDSVSPQFTNNSQSRNSNVPSETNDSIKPSVYAADDLFSTEIKFSKSHSAMQVFYVISAPFGTHDHLYYFFLSLD